MSKLLLDSNFIIAIFRESEADHDLAYRYCKSFLDDFECFVSNGVVSEVVTIVMMRTKSLDLTMNAFYFLKDNFVIVNEYELDRFNDRVFSVFQKYNHDTFKLSFVDCSLVVIANALDLDYVVSFDKKFSLFEEIQLFVLSK